MAGARDERLARERGEADAARYRVAQAQARLRDVRREHQAAQQRLDQLAAAPEAYAVALAAKERYLTESGDPRRRSLLALAEERGRLAAEVQEMTEAVQAAGAAARALAGVQDRLASASGWSTYDTFFGGWLARLGR
jgi:chromosome segregation ATPase